LFWRVRSKLGYIERDGKHETHKIPFQFWLCFIRKIKVLD